MWDENGKPLRWHILDTVVIIILVTGMFALGTQLVIALWELFHG